MILCSLFKHLLKLTQSWKLAYVLCAAPRNNAPVTHQDVLYATACSFLGANFLDFCSSLFFSLSRALTRYLTQWPLHPSVLRVCFFAEEEEVAPLSCVKCKVSLQTCCLSLSPVGYRRWPPHPPSPTLRKSSSLCFIMCGVQAKPEGDYIICGP